MTNINAYNNITATKNDSMLYTGLLRTAKRYDHYIKTWKLYNHTVKITKCHKQALDIAYWDLWLDTNGEVTWLDKDRK